MIVGLDHIAVAVPDLAEAIRRFTEDLGLELAGTEDVPSAQTRTAFLSLPATRIELVHPLDGKGPIQTFLDKRGGGLHHLCFRTDDLDGDVARLRAKGYRFTTDGPTPGAHGTRVIFVHPKSFGGVLVELAEHPGVIESVGEQTSLWDRKRRAGQRLLLGIAGTAPTLEEKELIAEAQPCGFVLFARNIEEPAQVRELNRELQALLPASVPPLLTVDQEGGRVQRIRATPWPAMRTVGNADDPAQTKALARAIGDEVRALGFNVDWAPVADVDSNPKSPVIGDRSFSSDPARVAKHVVAFLEGMRESGCIACVKHFPGHGDTTVDSHEALPRVEKDRDDVRNVELVPFAAAVRAGVPMVMSAHVVFPAWDEDRPATLSPPLLHGLLREELGFQGVLVSDDLDMKAVADRFAIADVVEQASLATVDLFLSCKDPQRQWALYEALVRAQEPSKIQEDRAIDAMARLKALREAHLRSVPPPPDLAIVGSAVHRDLAFALLAAGGA